MLDDTDLARLARYILGECSPEEHADTQRWIAQDPTRARAAASLEQLWRERRAAPAPPVDPSAWDVDAAWHRFTSASPDVEDAHVGDAPSRSARERRPLQLIPHAERATAARRRAQRAGAIAAALVLTVAGSFLWHHATSGRDHAASVAAVGQDTTDMREFRTTRAQRAEIRLTDGTLATLAPTSRLRISRDYATGARELYLEGEAYFEVRHDAAHPFRVYTRHGVTEDLGTKFAVRAYREDSVMRVAVAEGAVRLHAREVGPSGPRSDSVAGAAQANQSTRATIEPTNRIDTAAAGVIMAGHVGVLSLAGMPRVRAVADLTPYLAWTDGRLVFHDTPLRDVVTQLSRWYGLDIRLADARLGARVYTASFRDEPMSEVLRALEIALDVHAAHDGDVIVLTARHGAARR